MVSIRSGSCVQIEMFPGWLSLSQTRASKWKLIVKSRQTSVSDDFCPLKVTTGQLSGRHKPSHHIVWNFILSMTYLHLTLLSELVWKMWGKGLLPTYCQKHFLKMLSSLWYCIYMTMSQHERRWRKHCCCGAGDEVLPWLLRNYVCSNHQVCT